MSKSILISIKPQFVEKILNGEKTVEIRKAKPKCGFPVKVYIYCTHGLALYLNPLQLATDNYKTKKIWGAYDQPYVNGKVVAEFTLTKALWTCGWRLKGNTGIVAKRTQEEFELPSKSCVTIDEIVEYAGGDKRMLYMWNIENLKIYDEPKELSEFEISKAPQSWCYVKKEQL